MINLDEHKVYVESLKMEMVPLTIAQKAVAEATSETAPKLDEAMALIQDAFVDLNNALVQEEDE